MTFWFITGSQFLYGEETLAKVEKDAKEIADILRGNQCGMRGTSCADQFAKAIDQLV